MQWSYAIESRLPAEDDPLDAGGAGGAGEGTVLIVQGWAYCRECPIESLALWLGEHHDIPIVEWGRVRRDVLAEADAASDAALDRDERLRILRSGFRVNLPVAPAAAAQRITFRLIARLKGMGGGGVLVSKAHDVFVAPAVQNPHAPQPLFAPLFENPRVCICMATYNPQEAAFRRQVDSLRRQLCPDWICMVQDDASPPAAQAMIHKVLADDPRFVLACNERNAGFYANFERVLRRVPADCSLVCLCDQDDHWYPEKLPTLIDRLRKPGATLAYSDMRIVDGRGDVLSHTYWSMRRNNYTDIEALFFANTITGAASMFKAALLPIILPFPEPIGEAFHDWWIALVALAEGNVAYVDAPLYDYYQHDGNALGWASQISSPLSLWKFLRSHVAREKMGRRAFDMYRSQGAFLAASIDILRRRIPDSPRKQAIDRLSAINLRPLRAFFGQMIRSRFFRRASESQERNMFLAFLAARVRDLYFTATGVALRPTLSPTQIETLRPAHPGREVAVDGFERQTAPLHLYIRAAAPPRINMLLPAIDFRYVFGGYIAKFHLARRLAHEGFHVRLVIVETGGFDRRLFHERLQGFPGLEDLDQCVGVANCVDRNTPLEVSPRDRFISTTCWNAYIASFAAAQLSRTKRGRFVALIQEYEPFVVPHGSLHALSHSAYDLDMFAVFSTELLRDYFRANRIGVFSELEHGDRRSISFRNAILPSPVTHQSLRARTGRRKFLFYARPEGHAERNMFELGILALRQAMREGAFAPAEWTFEGIGAGRAAFTVPLPGAKMHVRPRMTLAGYADFLTGFDVGMALMHTPHPSLVPLEMAAAGLVTVTNSCANKTAEALAEISSNFEVGAPAVDDLAQALVRAQLRAGDFASRERGAKVNWPRSWDEALAPQVIAPLLAELRQNTAPGLSPAP